MIFYPFQIAVHFTLFVIGFQESFYRDISCVVLSGAFISRVFRLILVKLLVVFFFVFIIVSQGSPLGFLLYSQFVRKGQFVNSHNCGGRELPIEKSAF